VYVPLDIHGLGQNQTVLTICSGFKSRHLKPFSYVILSIHSPIGLFENADIIAKTLAEHFFQMYTVYSTIRSIRRPQSSAKAADLAKFLQLDIPQW